MPIESNEAEDNEEREGDFYSHAHTLVLSAGSAHCGMESFGKQTSPGGQLYGFELRTRSLQLSLLLDTSLNKSQTKHAAVLQYIVMHLKCTLLGW